MDCYFISAVTILSYHVLGTPSPNSIIKSTQSDLSSPQNEGGFSLWDWIFVLSGVLVVLLCCACIALVLLCIVKRRKLNKEAEENGLGIDSPRSYHANMPMIIEPNRDSNAEYIENYLKTEDIQDNNFMKPLPIVVEPVQEVETDQKVLDDIHVTIREEYETPKRPVAFKKISVEAQEKIKKLKKLDDPDDDPTLIAGLKETVDGD
eukprot:502866_1